MPLEIGKNDIVKMKIDAIVNASDPSTKGVGGICEAVLNAASSKEFQAACDHISHCAVGEAVSTEAFSLDADFIIHTVGPAWESGTNDEEALLRSCYRKSLELAHSLGCKSIATPLISTGIMGYPKKRAFRIAFSEIKKFLKVNDMHVYLVVYDREWLENSEIHTAFHEHESN